MSQGVLHSTMRWARSVTTAEQRKIVKFLVTGCIRTGLSYAIYLVGLSVGLSVTLALAADYVFAVITGFLMNRYWTFADQHMPRALVLRFLLAFGLAFLFEWLILQTVVEMGMSEELGRIPSLAVATIASYLMQRYWVFQTRWPLSSHVS